MWLVSAAKLDGSETAALAQILICTLDKRAYYLFGYENRSPVLRSAVSVSAAAHWEAMRQCAAFGVQYYDLNGYMIDIAETHPYHGVCRFKDQFAGKVIHYEIPEFRIQV